MAKVCPITGNVVLYLTCLECEDKDKCKDIKKEAPIIEVLSGIEEKGEDE